MKSLTNTLWLKLHRRMFALVGNSRGNFALVGRHKRNVFRSHLVEYLERRVLLTNTFIINDAFTDGPAYTSENISGRTPTLTDLPASAYQTAAGYGYNLQVLGTNTGDYADSASFHDFGAAAISLTSQGSYVKPTVFTVSGEIAFEPSSGYVSDALLGFYSAVPTGYNANDLLNFSGLEVNSNGAVTLITNGSTGNTVSYTGTYSPNTYVLLSYSLNTFTGSIYGVSLTGSSSDYTQFATNGFTNAATAYGGIGGDNAPSGKVHFAAYGVAAVTNAGAGKGVTAEPLGNVTIAAGTLVTAVVPDRPADRNVLLANSLTFAGTTNAWQGSLDLTGNDLIVHNGSLAAITNQIASGYNFAGGGNWIGQGLTSSSADNDGASPTALGVELNNDGNGNPLFGTGTVLGLFDGQSPMINDVLVKYTYFGDANLDGTVDGDDYTLIDNGYNNRLTGWRNGDFNYDGVVNGDDYTLIDNAFNTQGASLSAPTPAAQLVISQQPTNSTVGALISPAITVDVEDSACNLLLTNSSVVTLSIATGIGSLAGTVSAAAVNGVATFSNLSISTAGTYTLAAADLSVPAVFSQSFVVSPAISAGGLSNADPFGVASSYQSTGTYSTWAPQVAQAGVKWMRLFPEWNQIEPTQGTFDWSSVDAVTNAAAANNQYVSGLFYYDASWVNSNQGTFPTSNLPAWSAYVSALTAHTAGKVEYWEVWNEPQNFATGGTPQDYADVVVAAYNAAKAADPHAQIGLSVASVDINYLEQVIADGAADHFDYIAVHPYEVLNDLDQGWDADYLSIVPTIRKMLAANDPSKVNVPIWFTELGEQIGAVNGPQTVSAASQGQDLVKAYSMGIAEGVARMDWYQAEDTGDDTGFGLLDSNGNPQSAYTAMQSLTTYLGNTPQYLGWLQLNSKDNAFVFQGATTSVMVAWAQPNSADSVTFGNNVQIVNPLTGSITTLTAGSTLGLTSAPVFVVGVPSDLLSQAQSDKNQPFPWGGNYSNGSSVSIQMGAVNIESGLHQLSADETSQAVSIYGGSARLSNDSYSDIYQTFEVDPNFISYSPSAVNITVVARRDTNDDSAGFNIGYESTNGIKTSTPSGWWAIPGNEQWYSHTFIINDAEFDSKWGYNFDIDSLSPSNGEFYIQSVTVTMGLSV